MKVMDMVEQLQDHMVETHIKANSLRTSQFLAIKQIHTFESNGHKKARWKVEWFTTGSTIDCP